MTNSADHARRIAEIEAALRLPLPDAARQTLELTLRELRAEGANLAVANTVGHDLNQAALNLDHGSSAGVAVALNLGQMIYGRDPSEDERRRLARYLSALGAKLRRLPLRGLDPQLDEGGAGLSLARVYIELAVQSRKTLPVATIADVPFYEDSGSKQLKPEDGPDWALPSGAIAPAADSIDTARPDLLWGHRALLATEAVAQRQRLVLLGDPGSGKSTFLQYLAWALAQRGLEQAATQHRLLGWDDERQLVAVILPLRKLAGRLASANGLARGSKAARRRRGTEGMAERVVYAALRAEIERFGGGPADELLSEALHHGAALLLFDGLDEVPEEAVAGLIANRLSVLRAVRDFAQLYERTRIVITCRTRAFDQRLRDYLRWPEEQIAPFTLGQIRHFVPAWYGELVAVGQIEPAQASRLERELIDAVVASPKLRAMANTPLLLTMMALVLYHDGALPRDRPQVYERILELLLGQWDKLRDGQNLAEAIGQPDWTSERIQPVLDALSYAAHSAASSEDGRGRLPRGEVREALIGFFETARLPRAWDAAQRCLEYFEQRSGLLAPDETDSYVFAHLTLQEHCAGRYLLLGPDAAEQLMEHRADVRWREPIFLGLGVVQRTNPALIDRVLSDLIDDEEQGHAKSDVRRQQDLLLAAQIGADRDWNYLRTQRVNVERLQRDLRHGLVALLQDRRQPLTVEERIEAGALLGALGDPRLPITPDEWQREVQLALGNWRGRSYFCRVEPGTYTIGSSTDDPDADMAEQPQHSVTFDAPFWITRYPITNAQWQEFVRSGGRRLAYADDPDVSGPNQPAVGMTWGMCNEFCAWLSHQIGLTVRLPSEYEWEAAARGHDARRYPWGNSWQEDRAAIDQSRTQSRPVNTPVGCYPSGAAPCGALDMAGNVGEWMADVWHSYPGAPTPFTDLHSGVVRGGGALSDAISVRCAARNKSFFAAGSAIGLRVVLERLSSE